MNSYDKLRPWTEIEKCDCEKITSIVLVDIMTDNPIHCFNCKNEIDPEVLKLDDKLVDDIASWFSLFQSLYNLWLSSGEYEQYAKEKLKDSYSQVNIEGMYVAKKLSAHFPSYYWWFYDTDDGEPSHCPNCSQKLDLGVKYGTGKCEACNVVV
jgi:predicted  nucleic acid-binding Zn ribbon protein